MITQPPKNVQSKRKIPHRGVGFFLAGLDGVEPSRRESKSRVLPLDYSPKFNASAVFYLISAKKSILKAKKNTQTKEKLYLGVPFIGKVSIGERQTSRLHNVDWTILLPTDRVKWFTLHPLYTSLAITLHQSTKCRQGSLDLVIADTIGDAHVTSNSKIITGHQ